MSQFDEKKAYAAQEEDVFVSSLIRALLIAGTIAETRSLTMEEKKSSSSL